MSLLLKLSGFSFSFQFIKVTKFRFCFTDNTDTRSLLSRQYYILQTVVARHHRSRLCPMSSLQTLESLFIHPSMSSCIQIQIQKKSPFPWKWKVNNKIKIKSIVVIKTDLISTFNISIFNISINYFNSIHYFNSTWCCVNIRFHRILPW